MKLKLLSPLHSAYRQVNLYFEKPCAKHDLLPPEGHMLSYLAAYGPCSVSTIHNVLGLKKSTLSSALNRLEARSLLKRSAHPTDRRSIQVSIAPKGRKLASQIEAAGVKLEKRIEQEISQSDREAYHRVLEAIATCAKD